MTPTVVYVELLAAPIALLGSYLGNRRLVLTSISIICSLHFGIALTVRNTGKLTWMQKINFNHKHLLSSTLIYHYIPLTT